jgi:hypothetical protein
MIHTCSHCGRLFKSGAGLHSHLRGHVRRRAGADLEHLANLAGAPKSDWHRARRARLAEYVADRAVFDHIEPAKVRMPSVVPQSTGVWGAVKSLVRGWVGGML